MDYDTIIDFLKNNSVSRVLVQAPNGLKHLIPCIIEETIKRYSVEFIVSGSSTYCGCDIALDEARLFNVDAIIHIGHTEYPFLYRKPEKPILYIPAYYKWIPRQGFIEKLVKIFKEHGFKRIGLLASIQHVNVLEELVNRLKEYGLSAVIGRPKYENMYLGQVIGCEYSAAQSVKDLVDVYVVLAGGKFHALGLALTSNKPVLGVDPYSERIWNATEEARKYLAKRYYILSKLRYSGFKNVGIIVGVKPGQYRPWLIKLLVKYSEEMGVEYYLISIDELIVDRLIAVDNALKLDLYVVTSCPRIPIDDLNDFYKPVLTPGEYMMLYKGVETYIYPW